MDHEPGRLVPRHRQPRRRRAAPRWPVDHRRCRRHDGGRCTPATRRRDVGASTTVWGRRGQIEHRHRTTRDPRPATQHPAPSPAASAPAPAPVPARPATATPDCMILKTHRVPSTGNSSRSRPPRPTRRPPEQSPSGKVVSGEGRLPRRGIRATVARGGWRRARRGLLVAHGPQGGSAVRRRTRRRRRPRRRWCRRPRPGAATGCRPPVGRSRRPRQRQQDRGT
jgi:hypothetical protein